MGPSAPRIPPLAEHEWPDESRELLAPMIQSGRVYTVGQYNLVSMALNSFGVELDPGLEGFSRWHAR